MEKQCEFMKQDGTRCGAYAVKGSKYCFMHDPESAEAKQEAVRRGGSHKRERKLQPFVIKNHSDLSKSFVDTANAVLTGDLTPKEANSVLRALSALADFCKP